MIGRYLMTSRKKNDCGPKLLAYLANRNDADVEEAMCISDIERFSDFCDTPWHHWVALENLGVPFRHRTLTQILSGEFAPCKAAVLLHAEDAPTTSQHWVGIHSIDASYVWVWDGVHVNPVPYPVEAFKSLALDGWPNCFYEVGIGDDETTWYQRWAVWLTNAIFGG